jgi:excisionase family DNA binding protein
LSPNLPGDDAFLTTDEVLGYLQVNLRTVYRLIKSGQLPAVRVGRLWRFRKRDVDAWLDRHRTSPSPTASRDAVGRVSSTVSRRVLVVDDEPSMRELLSQTLALAAYEVDTTPDAEAALEMLRKASRPYDLLIADLRMPGMDGLSLIRRIRDMGSSVPIIIVTGFSSKGSAIDAVNLGVSGYLTKPFRVGDVLAAAARAMGDSAA